MELNEKNMELNFNEIYKKNKSFVYSWINYKLNGKKEIAEELTNDVFMRIHNHLNEYDENQSTLKTWIMNITNRIIIDYWRKKELYSINLEDKVNENGHVIDIVKSDIDIEKQMINTEMFDMVTKTINSLPKTYKKIAQMFFLDECSHDEISEQLSIPIGTVKGKIYRAKRILKAIIR